MRRFPVVLLAALLAGCGGTAKTSSPGGGAVVAPRSTTLLLRFDTSFHSAQWTALRALLGAFPEGKMLLAQAAGAGKALGPETDLVALGTDPTPKSIVGLTRPAHAADLETLLAKQEPPLVSEPVAGWRVIATSRATIDRFKRERNGGSLAGVDRYREATGDLPASPLASAYLDGQALTSMLDKRFKTGTESVPGLGRVSWLAGAVTARENGIRVEARIRGDAIKLASFEATLPEEVPGDVSLFVGFKGLDATLEELRRSGVLASALGVNGKLVGGLLADVIPLFHDEGALYARPGAPAELTLVLKVADETAATATLDRLATLIGALTQQVPETVTLGGVSAKKLKVQKLTLYYAVFDGKLVVTTAPSGILGLRQTGARLAGSQAWAGAKAAAEMPVETAGVLYADVPRAVQLLGGAVKLPPEVRRNLAPLKHALVYASVDGDVLSLSGFVAVR